MAFMGIDDGYVVYEASDEEECESSDDNDEFDYEYLFREGDRSEKTARQKRNIEADEFEKEMDQELTNTMDNLHASNRLLALPSTTGETSQTIAGKNTEEKKYYDEIYFDSDDEGGDNAPGKNGKNKKKKRKHPIISNDDLFYDPDMDQTDQDWVDQRRQSYKPKGGATKSNASKKLNNSDAVLNCPACMTTLCLDCQRHDTYKAQYRAMFVLNCKIDRNKVLRYPHVNKKRKAKASDNASLETKPDLGSDVIYHPVQCSTCNTEVAVQDKDEVYHFFNVLTSVA